jgi:alpha-mannosidase
MHDEATTHYMGMIDQTTLGHDFLKSELGVIPSVGWQIDPFGHSATQGGLLTAGFGFNSLYFGRMHYVELGNRQRDGECEGLWGSSLGGQNDLVFWGLSGSFNGNYGAPEGFCFDVLCDDDPLVGLEEEDLRERIKKFLNQMKVQTSRTKGNHIMLTMGMDFQFSQARKNFQNS